MKFMKSKPENSLRNFTLTRLALLMTVFAVSGKAATMEEISRWVGDGRWQQAGNEIAIELARTNLDFSTRQELLFQSDRITRMRLDFDKTRTQAFQDSRGVVPSITEKQFAAWDKNGAIEWLDVDGDRRYFHSAGANLFRINREARELKRVAGIKDEALYRLDDVRRVIAASARTNSQENCPKIWQVTYCLRVKPGEVPPGEIIRAWLPFPHNGNRQSHIQLISSDPPESIQANTNAALSSLYLEKPAAKTGVTEFKIVFEYTSDGFYQPIDPAIVQTVDTNNPALAPLMSQQPPQIVFSDAMTKLSHEIVGNETNPYFKARKIFAWVSENIRWASAREYSTIACLPEYALGCRHGDCGIKTMTFMTLCRLNDIPARWETGWTTDPVQDMHDWCEIFLAPYGWVPADVTYGLVNSKDDREKWFFLGGIDAGRLVVNTDYQQPLYPAKLFFRSEIVDFQRGEVEWRGGNLYFNQWTWEFKAKEAIPDSGLKRPHS